MFRHAVCTLAVCILKFNSDINGTEFCRKTRLITRNDLTIDWRILYNWAKVICKNHDGNHSLAIPPKSV